MTSSPGVNEKPPRLPKAAESIHVPVEGSDLSGTARDVAVVKASGQQSLAGSAVGYTGPADGNGEFTGEPVA